jgi:MarR family transcriptional regulator, organic hydroperoxide resistance regulator
MEVFLNLVRTADRLMRDFDELFKPYGLSLTQFNVLRILMYAEGEPLPCKAIAQRMITRDPDITRLLDRLEARKLISRERDPSDRRIVCTRITEEGMKLLEELNKPLVECHARQLAHMEEPQLTQLIGLLEQVRQIR